MRVNPGIIISCNYWFKLFLWPFEKPPKTLGMCRNRIFAGLFGRGDELKQKLDIWVKCSQSGSSEEASEPKHYAELFTLFFWNVHWTDHFRAALQWTSIMMTFPPSIDICSAEINWIWKFGEDFTGRQDDGCYSMKNKVISKHADLFNAVTICTKNRSWCNTYQKGL